MVYEHVSEYKPSWEYPDTMYCQRCKHDVQTDKRFSGVTCSKCGIVIVDTNPWIKIPVTIEEVIRESE